MRFKTIQTAAIFSMLTSALLIAPSNPARAVERLKPCGEPRFSAVATPSFGQLVGRPFRVSISANHGENDCFDVESGRQQRFVLSDALWRIDNGSTIRSIELSPSFATPGVHLVGVVASFNVLARPVGSTIWRETGRFEDSSERQVTLSVFPRDPQPGNPKIWPIAMR